ncbi:SDR family NAD(P)-dependent oxidoreductase [Hyphomonas polymorpha]|nr:SDR family NAD(P)-dependent oxidoreductase [Hyphomonas polymorpha]
MKTSLQGKLAIVTGGAGGMGRSHALRLAELGANVAIIDIDLKVAARYGETLSAASVRDEILNLGRDSIAIEADLSDRKAAFDAVHQIERHFGRIDILVNNAGGAITPIGSSSASMASEEDRNTLFAANFHTAVNMCQACVPALIKEGGVIVNISTVGVCLDDAAARFAMYSASKAAVEKYTRSLAVELGPKQVRVNCIAPGLIATPRVASQAAARNLATGGQADAIPLRRLGQASDITGVVEFLVSDLASYVTGECIRVSGGLQLQTRT